MRYESAITRDALLHIEKRPDFLIAVRLSYSGSREMVIPANQGDALPLSIAHAYDLCMCRGK
jgi:hypothetical protein